MSDALHYPRQRLKDRPKRDEYNGKNDSADDAGELGSSSHCLLNHAARQGRRERHARQERAQQVTSSLKSNRFKITKHIFTITTNKTIYFDIIIVKLKWKEITLMKLLY